jgi:hypothetical protein
MFEGGPPVPHGKAFFIDLDQCSGECVRFGSLEDMGARISNVREVPLADIGLAQIVIELSPPCHSSQTGRLR